MTTEHDPWGDVPDVPLAVRVAAFHALTWATDPTETTRVCLALLGQLDAVARHDAAWVMEHNGHVDPDFDGPDAHDPDVARTLFTATLYALRGWRDRQQTGPITQTVTVL